MRNSLADVVSAALRVLDAQGLEGCSMRRVAAELDVQPSALYHHVPDKQTLLALMADEIVRGVGAAYGDYRASAPVEHGETSEHPGADGSGSRTDTAPDDARAVCVALRGAMLGVRDGADVVATATAFRLGSSAVERQLAALVGADGARTLLLYTFGHAQSTQTHLQAAALGALVDPAPASTAPELDASFERGLDIVLAGLGSESGFAMPA